MAGKGYNTEGDVLVNLTADGVDLNMIWAEIREVLELYNSVLTGTQGEHDGGVDGEDVRA